MVGCRINDLNGRDDAPEESRGRIGQTRMREPTTITGRDRRRQAFDGHRAAEIDAAYAAYDAHPIEEPDVWGDLAWFREAAAAS